MVLTDVNNSSTEQFSKYQTAGPWILYWIRGKLTDLQTCSPASLHLDSNFLYQTFKISTGYYWPPFMAVISGSLSPSAAHKLPITWRINTKTYQSFTYFGFTSVGNTLTGQWQKS